MSTVVDDPAREDIASPVTGGEVVPLASRATWLATGSGGAGTVTTIGLQFGTAGVVTAGLVGLGGAVGVAALRRFAPGTVTRLGPRRAAGAGRGVGASHRVGGRPGRAGRGAGTGGDPRRGGLLGAARRVAGGVQNGTGRSGAGRRRDLLGGGRQHQAGGRSPFGGRRRAVGRVRGTGAGVDGAAARRGRGLLTRRGGGDGGLACRGAGRAPGRSGAPGSGKPGAPLGRLFTRGRGSAGSARSTKGAGSSGKDTKPGLWGWFRGRAEAGKRGRARVRRVGLMKRAPRPVKAQKAPQPLPNRADVNKHKARPDETAPKRELEGSTAMPNPFNNHNEALHQAASNLDIENARALIDWVDGAPEAAEKQAGMWRKHATTIQESIPVSGEFAEAINDFAATQALQAGRIREAGIVFRRTHEEQLRRIDSPKPGEDKWDVSKNR